MQVDFQRLSAALDGAQVELADEGEFRAQFPDCEVGAMPPFGNLYDMAVYVDEHLTKDDDIAFNACSHTELLQVPYADYAELVKPTVLSFVAGGH